MQNSLKIKIKSTHPHHSFDEKLIINFMWPNLEDSFTVSKIKDDTIIGHVPCKKSCVVWYFKEL